jgi:hypothetical protein
MAYPRLGGTVFAPAQIEVPRAGEESPADRVLLMLLALSLMLLAFFVVLTSASTFDERRTLDAVKSVKMTFVRPHDQRGVSEQQNVGDSAHRAAVAALRVSISDVFAPLLVGQAPESLGNDRVTPDRVEVDVPAALFFNDGGAALYPLPIIDKIITVLSAPPTGYRMELVVRLTTSGSDNQIDHARLAILADDLVRRGLSPTALSIGTLDNLPNAAKPSLRFTFLLLDTDEDLAAARLMKVTP